MPGMGTYRRMKETGGFVAGSVQAQVSGVCRIDIMPVLTCKCGYGEVDWDTGSGIRWGKADVPRELGRAKEATWPEQWMQRKLSAYENINNNP